MRRRNGSWSGNGSGSALARRCTMNGFHPRVDAEVPAWISLQKRDVPVAMPRN